jgi:biotin carboxyl carrier protein
MHEFKHPKYYAELRKQRRKLTSAQAPAHKRPSLPSKAQASSQSPQAPGSEHQGTSVPSPYPGNKQQE